LLWEEDGTLYPLEIKKTVNPASQLANAFSVLEKSDKILGNGGVVCMRSDFAPLDGKNSIIPIRCL